jgi:acyl-[acyl-carrier-protein]-phospholipid O-acyltransferase/long-chain-fatty-acid--[acyl-carrier-protein] ligase
MTSTLAESRAETHDTATSGLLSRSFLGLLFTQFLTATNDNIFRWLVIGIGKDYVAERHHSTILMIGTASFVLPYLVLAAYAGFLADRFSKRSVIVACKVAEIAIMSLGVVAIWLGSLPLLFVAVALTSFLNYSGSTASRPPTVGSA